jgi:hypothetical protein
MRYCWVKKTLSQRIGAQTLRMTNRYAHLESLREMQIQEKSAVYYAGNG